MEIVAPLKIAASGWLLLVIVPQSFAGIGFRQHLVSLPGEEFAPTGSSPARYSSGLISFGTPTIIARYAG